MFMMAFDGCLMALMMGMRSVFLMVCWMVGTRVYLMDVDLE